MRFILFFAILCLTSCRNSEKQASENQLPKIQQIMKNDLPKQESETFQNFDPDREQVLNQSKFVLIYLKAGQWTELDTVLQEYMGETADTVLVVAKEAFANYPVSNTHSDASLNLSASHGGSTLYNRSETIKNMEQARQKINESNNTNIVPISNSEDDQLSYAEIMKNFLQVIEEATKRKNVVWVLLSEAKKYEPANHQNKFSFAKIAPEHVLGLSSVKDNSMQQYINQASEEEQVFLKSLFNPK